MSDNLYITPQHKIEQVIRKQRQVIFNFQQEGYLAAIQPEVYELIYQPMIDTLLTKDVYTMGVQNNVAGMFTKGSLAYKSVVDKTPEEIIRTLMNEIIVNMNYQVFVGSILNANQKVKVGNYVRVNRFDTVTAWPNVYQSAIPKNISMHSFLRYPAVWDANSTTYTMRWTLVNSGGTNTELGKRAVMYVQDSTRQWTTSKFSAHGGVVLTASANMSAMFKSMELTQETILQPQVYYRGLGEIPGSFVDVISQSVRAKTILNAAIQNSSQMRISCALAYLKLHLSLLQYQNNNFTPLIDNYMPFMLNANPAALPTTAYENPDTVTQTSIRMLWVRFEDFKSPNLSIQKQQEFSRLFDSGSVFYLGQWNQDDIDDYVTAYAPFPGCRVVYSLGQWQELNRAQTGYAYRSGAQNTLISHNANNIVVEGQRDFIFLVSGQPSDADELSYRGRDIARWNLTNNDVFPDWVDINRYTQARIDYGVANWDYGRILQFTKNFPDGDSFVSMLQLATLMCCKYNIPEYYRSTLDYEDQRVGNHYPACHYALSQNTGVDPDQVQAMMDAHVLFPNVLGFVLSGTRGIASTPPQVFSLPSADPTIMLMWQVQFIKVQWPEIPLFSNQEGIYHQMLRQVINIGSIIATYFSIYCQANELTLRDFVQYNGKQYTPKWAYEIVNDWFGGSTSYLDQSTIIGDVIQNWGLIEINTAMRQYSESATINMTGTSNTQLSVSTFPVQLLASALVSNVDRLDSFATLSLNDRMVNSAQTQLEVVSQYHGLCLQIPQNLANCYDYTDYDRDRLFDLVYGFNILNCTGIAQDNLQVVKNLSYTLQAIPAADILPCGKPKFTNYFPIHRWIGGAMPAITNGYVSVNALPYVHQFPGLFYICASNSVTVNVVGMNNFDTGRMFSYLINEGPNIVDSQRWSARNIVMSTYLFRNSVTSDYLVLNQMTQRFKGGKRALKIMAKQDKHFKGTSEQDDEIIGDMPEDVGDTRLASNLQRISAERQARQVARMNQRIIEGAGYHAKQAILEASDAGVVFGKRHPGKSFKTERQIGALDQGKNIIGPDGEVINVKGTSGTAKQLAGNILKTLTPERRAELVEKARAETAVEGKILPEDIITRTEAEKLQDKQELNDEISNARRGEL